MKKYRYLYSKHERVFPRMALKKYMCAFGFHMFFGVIQNVVTKLSDDQKRFEHLYRMLALMFLGLFFYILMLVFLFNVFRGSWAK